MTELGAFIIASPPPFPRFIDVEKWLRVEKYEDGFRYMQSECLDHGITVIWLGNDKFQTKCVVTGMMQSPVLSTAYEREVKFAGGPYP